MNKQFFIFTDGSAIGNPGPAGWAAIVIHGTRRQEIAGSVPWSTVSEILGDHRKTGHLWSLQNRPLWMV